MEYQVEDLPGTSMVTVDVDGIEGVFVGKNETSEQAAKRMLAHICSLEACCDWGGRCWLVTARSKKR